MGMTMSDTEFLWAKQPGGKVHIVEGHEPTTIEVNDTGGVDERIRPLCGRGIDTETHRFKGFDKHRGLDFCSVCRDIYNDRNPFPTDD